MAMTCGGIIRSYKSRAFGWANYALLGLLGCNEQVEFNSGNLLPEIPPSAGPVPALPSHSPQSTDLEADRSWQIPAAVVDEAAFTFTYGTSTLSEVIELKRGPRQSQTLQQAERPLRLADFSQGNPGTPVTQRFALSEAGKLDLLIVMDNSSTMQDYQEKLSTNLPALLSALGNTNWQIAVVTTDNHCLRNHGRPITRALYDSNRAQAEAEFRSAIQAGTSGNTMGERGLLQAVKALRAECEPQPWLRDKSHTAVLLVTDEENCGSGSNEPRDGGCLSANGTWVEDYYAEYFIRAVQDLGRESTRVFGLLYDQNPRIGQDQGRLPRGGGPAVNLSHRHRGRSEELARPNRGDNSWTFRL